MPNPKGNVDTLTHYQGKWKLGKTKTIRVPVVIADDLLSLARLIDEGDYRIDKDKIIKVDETKDSLLDTIKLLLSLFKPKNKK